MIKELVHVMLKPDALEFGLRDIIIQELQKGEGEIITSRRLVLSLEQISSIYSNFSNDRAKPVVFAYFTSRETEHLAIIGSEELHKRLDVIKGQTGTGNGIRGKYYTRYTKLSPLELQEWLSGTLSNAEDIDLEMFGRDIIHTADTQPESLAGLRAVMTPPQLDLIRFKGFGI
jgi:nucleoside diphosphate kinase